MEPNTAGILNIVAGSLSLTLFLLLLIGLMIFLPVATGIFSIEYTGFTPHLSLAFLFLITTPAATIALLAIIGGIFTLQRKKWGWALTNSIATCIISTPLGVAAIIFTALSKDEFG